MQEDGGVLHIFTSGLRWNHSKAHEGTAESTQQMCYSVPLFNVSLTSRLHLF